MSSGRPGSSGSSPNRPGRSRRSKKSINYSKEQEFSDGDIFEDKDEVPPPSQTKKKRSRPRKNAEIPVTIFDMNADDVPVAQRSVYVEKGYDPNELPLREKYLFLPEFEPDGSPKIDLIVGRRPIKKRKSGRGVSEDEESDADGNSSDDEQKNGNGNFSFGNRRKKNKKSSRLNVDYEYLVKYKGKSYLHLEWKTASDLESMNKSAKTLLRRYLKKIDAGLDETLEDPTFDNSYAIPQKVVAEKEETVMVELSDKELIAWEKRREKEIAEYSDEGEGGEAKVEEEKKERKKAGQNNMDVDEKDKANNANSDKEKNDGECSFIFISFL